MEKMTFTYPGGDRPALDGVTLTLRRGEVVLVAGRAGAGTSTLLLVAAGFAPRVTGGTLTGRVEMGAARPGIVFATPWTQLTGMCRTVLAEVAFGPASFGAPREAVLGAARNAMRMLGVTQLADRDPTTLSGGELQRVVVASAIANDPDLLALDDPAAELDPAAADSLYAMLASVATRGAAVLIATPDIDRAAAVATRVLWLDGGKLTADGSPQEVLGGGVGGIPGTDVAEMARAAGCAPPLPLTVDELARRIAR
jgi:energy-coupling factor transporter ATP-binding protein EcfA2